MRKWISRTFAVMFMLSLVTSPQMVVMAQDQPDLPNATPLAPGDDGFDSSITPDPDDVREGDDSGESSDGPTEPETPPGTTESDPSVIQGSNTDAGPSALLEDNYLIGLWDWDGAALTGILGLLEDFAAEEGDTIRIYFSSDSLTLDSGPYPLDGLPVEVTADAATETFTLTFTEDYVSGTGEEGFQVIDLAFPGTINFPVCGPSDTTYTNTAYVRISSPNYPPYVLEVEGEECAAAGGAAVESVEFIFLADFVGIGIDVSPTGVTDGTQLTVTYPADVLDVEAGPVNIYGYTGDGLVPDVVGSAVASDGVITITLQEFVPQSWDDEYLQLWIGASLSTAMCDPEQEQYLLEHGRIYFVAEPGGTFESLLPTSTEYGFQNAILCNAAPASKTGEISEDGTQVHWVIDTGDLINGGIVDESLFSIPEGFDCDSIVVTAITPGIEWDVQCDTEWGNGFVVYLYGEGPVRAQIEFTVPATTEADSIPNLNCAMLIATGFMGDQPMNPTALSTNTAGVGAMVCAEALMAGGGDSITNVASADSLYQGDELTFTVEYTTSSTFWTLIALDDILPVEGYEVTDISCTFEPEEAVSGECEVQDDNTILFMISRSNPMEEEFTGGAQINLVITGVVTAEPGTELFSEACGARSIDLEGLPPIFAGFGSDPICATAMTTVLQVPVTETPIPSPTPTGTAVPTGTVTPATPPSEASPSAPADPTATSGVTSLPETGNRGPSAGSSFFIVALATGILIAAGIGMQLRPRDS